MNIRTFSSIFLAGTISSHAAITTITTSVPTSLDFFSDGTGDYFGIVRSVSGGTGTLEPSGLTFTSNTAISPIVGSLTGRDHDDGDAVKSPQLTALWSLALPGGANPGTGFSNINFTATLAAKANGWDNSTGDIDNIIFELLLNGSVVATRAFQPTGAFNVQDTSLALDTNNDGVGDGLAISQTGTGFTITNSGGSTINSLQIRGMFTSNDGEAAYWVSGILSGNYDMVPEPSSAFLLGLGSLCLLARRSRITVNS